MSETRHTLVSDLRIEVEVPILHLGEQVRAKASAVFYTLKPIYLNDEGLASHKASLHEALCEATTGADVPESLVLRFDASPMVVRGCWGTSVINFALVES